MFIRVVPGLALVLAAGCGGVSGTDIPALNWTITTSGGTFRSPDHAVTLIVPPGAVTVNTKVHPTPLTTAPVLPDGAYGYVFYSGYQFTPVTFASPVTLRVFYGASYSIPEELSIMIYRLPDGSSTWEPVPTTIDRATHTATAQITTFSHYAAFVYLHAP